MPLDKETHISIENGSLVLMSLKISNSYRPSYQPYVLRISVLDIQKAEQLERDSNELQTENATFEENAEEQPDPMISILPGSAVEKKPNQYNRYLVSFQVHPGRYEISWVHGGSGIFPIKGQFDFPINAKFEVPPNSTIYIGELVMDNRKSKDGERHSGGLFPLIDQAVTGFSGGTFKVVINDNFDRDIALFKDRYPKLETDTVAKAIATISLQEPKP
jgi:hypothetical protein